MAESLVLFESVINSRWFLRTSIILFMNKIDLFAAKLSKIPLEKFFTDYTGNIFCTLYAGHPGRMQAGEVSKALTCHSRRTFYIRRTGYQQGCKVHSLAIHSNQSRASPHIPSVSFHLLMSSTWFVNIKTLGCLANMLFCSFPFATFSMTQATDTLNVSCSSFILDRKQCWTSVWQKN